MGAKKGDEAALTHLLALARDVLLRDLRPRMSGGWTEDWLEDVVQEALIDICVHHGTCRARTLGELVAWIKAIGRREAATLHRNNAKWIEACAAAALGNDTGTTSCSDTPSAASEALRSRLRTLGPTAHELLWLKYFMHATWKEIALEIGTTPAGAKRRYQRMVVRLRRSSSKARDRT